MSTPRPCVLLWLAREGTSDEQYAAYDRLIRKMKLPEKRSTVVVGDEPKPIAVQDMISGLPVNERYQDAALEAAKKNGFFQSSFVVAVLFREANEALAFGVDESPLRFIGRFEFPFPERGDYIGRDDQEWLGLDESYCLDEDSKGNDKSPTKPWWRFWR